VNAIDLSGDDLGLPTAPHIREAAQRALDEGATHYTTRPGLDPLREAVAAKLRRENGIEVDPKLEVLITCGAQEAIFVALHVLLQPGDEALIPQPALRSHTEIVRLAGGVARPVPTDPAGGFGIDPAEVARRAGPRARVVLLHSPSPAGAVADESALRGLAELAVTRGLVVVSVETLERFVHDGAAHTSIASLPGMAERTVTINGFSAAYGMRGWRVGYMAGPRPLMAPMIQLKQALSICSPAVSQYAALAAITGPDAPVETAQRTASERRARALAALTAANVRAVEPDGAYHVMLDCRGRSNAGDELARATEQATGVRLTAGSKLGATSWLRLSLTQPPELIEEAATRLGPALAANGGAHG
jgi:aminotransferase